MEEKALQEKAFEAIELAKRTGRIKKGSNEVTKVLEKGMAKLVVYAEDVNPKEIVMHLEPLAKEKGVPCIKVPSREELGTVAGLKVSTTAVAIVNEGDAKKIIDQIKKGLGEE